MEVKFEIGWVDNPVEGKSNKGGPKRSNGKGKNNIKPLNGPAKRNGKTKEETKKSTKRGSWTRLYTGPKNQDGMEFIELESDRKRKCDAMKTNLSKDTNMGKKQRLDEETRSLSILMATHLGSAEVTE